MLDAQEVIEQEEDEMIEELLASQGFTREYFEACGGGAGEGPMSDHAAQFWDDAVTSIAKHAKRLQKTIDRVLERASAVAHAALDGLDAQADLAERRDGALRDLHAAAGRQEADPAEVEAAAGRAEEAAEALAHSIAANTGTLLVLLRRLRSLDRASKLVARLSDGGVLEELAEHVRGIPSRRGLAAGLGERFAQQERDASRVEADYWLHELDVGEAERTAALHGSPLPASLPRFREAEAVLEGLREGRDVSGVLEWVGRHRGRLGGGGDALEEHCRLQQCVEMLRAGDDDGARAFLASWGAGAPGGGEGGEARRLGARLLAAGRGSGDPLLGEWRWGAIERSFKDCVYAVYGPTGHRNPLLVMLVAAGLIGVKTRNQAGPAGGHRALRAYEEASARGEGGSGPWPVGGRRPKELRHAPLAGKTPDHDTFYRLAKGLPAGSRPESVLLCPFTGKRMDEGDPPCRLPNGFLMPKSVVERVCREFDDGGDRTLWEWLELDALIGGGEGEEIEGGGYSISQVIAA